MPRTFSFEIQGEFLGEPLVIRNLLENLFQAKFQEAGGVERLAQLQILEFNEGDKERKVDFLLSSNPDQIILRFHNNPGLKLCFFYEGGLPLGVLEELGPRIPLPVGLFNLEKFRKGSEEYSELARLEQVVKQQVRRSLSTTTRESDLSKAIDWKLLFSSNCEGSAETPAQVSLLSDPSMRDLMNLAIRIVEKLGPAAEALGKIRSETKAKLKEIQKREGSFSKEDFQVFSTKLLQVSQIAREKSDTLNFRKIPTVLIEGATGTGKSLLARFLFERVNKKSPIDLPFSKVPLVNLSESVLEGELFGVIPGTYTGSQLRMGKILSNIGGVVFFDEIGDVPLSMQPKLLTYLDDMVVQMSGWSDPKEIIAPVIIIAATNRNLKEAVRQGTFREDLYHRFTYRLRLPDLKDRRDDFRFLLSYALQKRNQLEGENIARISIQAIEKLERYDYPGNFRELESVVSRAIARAAIMERTIILAEDIDFA